MQISSTLSILHALSSLQYPLSKFIILYSKQQLIPLHYPMSRLHPEHYPVAKPSNKEISKQNSQPCPASKCQVASNIHSIIRYSKQYPKTPFNIHRIIHYNQAIYRATISYLVYSIQSIVQTQSRIKCPKHYPIFRTISNIKTVFKA